MFELRPLREIYRLRKACCSLGSRGKGVGLVVTEIAAEAQ